MQHLANPYELIELIGRGPNGTVWRATHRATRELLAVKVLDARFSRDRDVLDRLDRERPVLTAFVHPADVRVREVFDQSGQVALAMELVEGGDLRRHLVHLGTFAPALAARLGAAAAEALAAAHQVGVVHCDVKPSNVLIARPSGDVRITDYRVARLLRGYGEGAGRFSDPGYAAPEVILGGPPVPGTDVYGLGLVLYEMLTGAPLCFGTDPLDVLSRHLRRRPVVPSDVTPKLRLLVEECLAVDPGARPSADELAERLSRLVAALPGDPQIRVWPPAVAMPTPRLPAPPTWPPRLAHTGPAVGESDDGEPPEPDTTPVSSAAGPVARPASSLSRRRPIVALLVTVLLIAVGLTVATVMDRQGGGGSTGGRGAAVDPSAGPSLASAASVPKPPASAAPATAEGAAAFVRYWFDTIGYGTATGNTAPLEAASTPDCTVCGTVLKAIRSAYDGGNRMRGGQYTIRDTSSDSFFNLDQPKVIVVYDRAPRSTVGTGGAQVEATPGASFITAIVILERVEDRWRVRGVTSAVPFA